MSESNRPTSSAEAGRTDAGTIRACRRLFRAVVALFAVIGLVAVVIVIANAREPYGGPLDA